MALDPFYLADTSVLARLQEPKVADRVGPLLVDGFIATCPMIDLEVLYSARSLGDYDAILEERQSLPSCPITEVVTDRALEVQHQLAARGQHRLPLPDLIIAAVAETNELTVLHYDRDYDIIAAVTHQPVSWVVPQGQL